MGEVDIISVGALKSKNYDLVEPRHPWLKLLTLLVKVILETSLPNGQMRKRLKPAN